MGTARDAIGMRMRFGLGPSHLGLIMLGLLVFGLAVTGLRQVPAAASTSALGGINVEPSARPWHYVGANPDSWWCPTASQCTTSNPLGRIDTEMALAQQLHVANVRLEIPWFLVEPSNGSYDWTRADYIFNSAGSHGIQIQPILVYTPSWLGAYDSFPAPAAFQTFVSAFMARYGGNISAVEMWNEPDGGQSLLQNDPVQYVNDILIPGYNAVKQSAHPGVSVIEGGSINDSGGTATWLNGIYNAGGGSYFDIAAFHDYGGNYGQIVSLYQGVINAHPGNGSKPIWLGEYGVSDASGSQQSSLITAALTATPGLAMAQFYTLRDEGVYTCCPPASTGENKVYGVVAADDVTKKPSFNTMQSLLGGSSPPPTPSAAPTPTPSAAPTPSATPTPKATPTPSATPAPTPSPAPPPPPPPSSVPTVGGLHVQGNQIKDANGNIVRLQGANMAGTEFVCAQGWTTDPFGGQPEDSAQTFAAMRSWHVNVVRVPLNEDCWLGINGVKIGGAAYQSVIIKLVQDLRAAGFYVIVDLHWTAPGTQMALSQNPAPDEDHSPAFWTSVAATFKSDEGVIYDLFNEPFFYWIAPGGPNEWTCLMNGCTITQYETGGTPFTVTANWKSAGMNELISDVRGTGAQNLVMVAGVNWARDLSGWLANRPQGSNLAASWHSYPSANPSLTSECAALACWNSVVAPLASQVPIVVGETGDSAGGPETYLPTFLPWASGHGLSVIAWTWNGWTNPDDVLVSNMQTGSPTSGEGVTYKAWLTAQAVQNPVPNQPSFTPPPPPTVKQPSGSTAAVVPHTQPASVKHSIQAGLDQPGAVTEPAASAVVQPAWAAAADRFGLGAICLGFVLSGFAVFLWSAARRRSLIRGKSVA